LCLTELENNFLVNIGSEAGRLMLSGVELQPATAFMHNQVSRGLEEARLHMGRTLEDYRGLPDILLNNLELPQYEDVARRCLSCTNCTQVCPTCFCWDTLEVTDLANQTASRQRLWDSCFNPEYSYVFGGNTRLTVLSRYRQWITHKLGGWWKQYGVSGCVGCGRCITWCPAGIDITAEAAALRNEVKA
jgi:sulfhydrogenase subunit beta (sulfur reductase)